MIEQCFKLVLSTYFHCMEDLLRHKTLSVTSWLFYYCSTCLAAAGAFWFAGDLNANGWTSPGFAPPSWVFGPVWSALYLLIATSGFVINKSKHQLTGLANSLWAVQITANTLWTPVFFGAFDLKGALYISIVLWSSISLYILVALKASKLAGYLFIPYWLWVSLATYLNYSYLRLNP